jgi:hypothetical protein
VAGRLGNRHFGKLCYEEEENNAGSSLLEMLILDLKSQKTKYGKFTEYFSASCFLPNNISISINAIRRDPVRSGDLYIRAGP